jgi:hypothetical protein
MFTRNEENFMKNKTPDNKSKNQSIRNEKSKQKSAQPSKLNKVKGESKEGWLIELA